MAPLQSDHEFAPSEIARAVFPTAFRGYDQDAVRRYLGRLAAALEHQQEYGGLGPLEARPQADDRVDELEAEISELQGEIRELELELVQRSVEGQVAEEEASAGSGSADFDEHRAIELLGQETARVLESARSAAADILKRAEKQAASLKAEAKRELAQARRRSAALMTEKEAEVEELVTRLADQAEAEARRIASDAEEHRVAVVEESAKILAEAEAQAQGEQAGAEDRARQIVADAETLRQQVIAELVAERRQAQADLDRMVGARDRLAMSLAVARSELDEVADSLVEASTLRADAGAAEASPVDEGEVARLIEELDDGPRPAGGVADGAGAADDTVDDTAAADDTGAVDDTAAADDTTDETADKARGGAQAIDDEIDGGLEPTEEMPAITPTAAAGVFDLGDGPQPAGGRGRGPEAELEVLSIGDLDVDAAPDSLDDLNQPPPDGSPLSLVEGFSTIELADDERNGAGPIDLTDGGGVAPAPSRSRGGARRGRHGQPDPEVVPVGALADGSTDPAEIITTVSSRAAGSQPDRSRGDLPLADELDEAPPAIFEARDVALTKAGPNFRRQLRRALNDDQSEILERLRGGRGAIKVDELPPYGDQIDHYLAPLRLGLADIARAGARAGGADDLGQPALDNLIRQLARFIVDWVRLPTVAAIEEADHVDREQILDPVRAVYRDLRNVGLAGLADDALHEAFAIGLYDSLAAGDPVRWIVDPRTDPDPVCEVNRDRRDLTRGQAFPSGHVRPLSLPGCRCLVVAADHDSLLA